MILSGKKCEIYEYFHVNVNRNNGYAGVESEKKVILVGCGEGSEENTGFISRIHEYYSQNEDHACPVIIVCFYVKNWNDDFSPWREKAVFGNEDFGGKGEETLSFLRESLMPFLCGKYGPDVPFYIAGYSLSGLFSLWSLFECDEIKGCAACSPSVWFDGWREYCTKKTGMEEDKASCEKSASGKTVYLSLGDKEAFSKNERLNKVDENIRFTADITKGFLEYNPGGHFKDVPDRLLKGIIFLTEKDRILENPDYYG
ncbi:MAG: hypothetical protein K6D96_10745 [Acetatifactor sp.]|nr:hypothetical protein [Acetatifactor sp.]